MTRFPRRGTPESFGWLRVPAFDDPGFSAWEVPDRNAAFVLLPVGTRRLVQMLPSLPPLPDLVAARR